MLELADDTLTLRLPELHRDAALHMEFRRTLRSDTPADAARSHDQGRFALRDVDGCVQRRLGRGATPAGVFFPMHQSEAMRFRVATPRGYPFALRVSANGIDAFTGERARNDLLASFANYRVILHTREIGGMRLPTGAVQPFVVRPLVRQATMVEQLTGAAVTSTLHVTLYPMRAARYEALRAAGSLAGAAGARETFGPAAWDQEHRTQFFVHVLNTRQYLEITGRIPPMPAPTAEDYARAGLPWLEQFDLDQRVFAVARRLVSMDEPARTGDRPRAVVSLVHTGAAGRRSYG